MDINNFDKLKLKAENFDLAASLVIGLVYLKHPRYEKEFPNIKKDYNKAFKYLENYYVGNLKNGNSVLDKDSLLALAKMYLNGVGTSKNIDEALSCLNVLSHSDETGTFLAGLLYLFGIEVKRDFNKAFLYFHRINSLDEVNDEQIHLLPYASFFMESYMILNDLVKANGSLKGYLSFIKAIRQSYEVFTTKYIYLIKHDDLYEDDEAANLNKRLLHNVKHLSNMENILKKIFKDNACDTYFNEPLYEVFKPIILDLYLSLGKSQISLSELNNQNPSYIYLFRLDKDRHSNDHDELKDLYMHFVESSLYKIFNDIEIGIHIKKEVLMKELKQEINLFLVDIKSINVD